MNAIHKNTVYLVGVGPGDPELISVKALRLIETADCIVYDRLINDSILNFAKPGVKTIYVGKKPGNHSKTQQEINNILLDNSKRYKRVVRLKGGDPFVFGRGGEEAIFLKSHNTQFELVPGITSAIAVPEYAGIPVTHRGIARSFAVITAHSMMDYESEEYTWKKAVKHIDTLVFLMGVKKLPKIIKSLLEEGLSPTTPIAIIQQGTLPVQNKRIGTLNTILDIIKKKPVFSPCIIIVGKTILLEPELRWFENRPLFGKTIVVTRARHQVSELRKRLEHLGANVITLPAISLSIVKNNLKLHSAFNNIKTYQWIVFTSVNAVEIFFSELYRNNFDSRVFSNCHFASIGEATANRLKDFGILADVTPKRFVAEELAKEMNSHIFPQDKILIPRAIGSRKFLVEFFLKKDCLVEEIGLYESILDKSSKDTMNELLSSETKISCITFTSSSTVKNFFQLCEDTKYKICENTNLYSIGPITSSTLREYTENPIYEATEYSINGLIETIIKNEMKNIS